MSLEEDLAILMEQEELLRFPRFNVDIAWALGGTMRELAAGAANPVMMGIWMAGRTMFVSATAGASGLGITPGNEDWLRRKRNTVERFGKSSLRVGLELERDKTTLEARQGLMLADFATHGGGLPLAVTDCASIGAIVVSGLTQREDHSLVVIAVSTLLKVPVPQLMP